MRSVFSHYHTAIPSPWLPTTTASLKHRRTLDCEGNEASTCSEDPSLYLGISTPTTDFTTIRRVDKKMKSSFSCKSAQNGTATVDHDLLHVQDDCRMHDICPQSFSDPSTIRVAGFLRYSRESENHRLNLAAIPQMTQFTTEYPVQCEYCREKAHPPLDLTWIHNPETHFCCAQRQQLCQILVKQTLLFEERSDLVTGNLTLEEETEMLCYKAREREALVITDLLGKFRVQSGKSIVYKGYPVNLRAARWTSVPAPGVLRLRLSSAQQNAGWTVHPSTSEKLLEKNEEVTLPFFDQKPVQFGICYHQVVSGFLQKFYSSGIKFLTMFPDGSAQVFYPSGLLAVLIVVTEHNGRVCIVYDDASAPNRPIRAVFQSDGRATCYHTNGSIWMALNISGGRCLNDAGTTTCRWSWGTPTPLQPIFLSLNKSVGVRVLGNSQVFVSFFAGRQQAKFSVGTCCAQGEREHTSGSLISKDELLALAAKIRIHVAIQHLHQCLTPPSHPQMLKPTPTPHLQVAAQKLLKVSEDVMMSNSDRAFICRCLQDC